MACHGPLWLPMARLDLRRCLIWLTPPNARQYRCQPLVRAGELNRRAKTEELNGELYRELNGELYRELNGELYRELNGELYRELNGELNRRAKQKSYTVKD